MCLNRNFGDSLSLKYQLLPQNCPSNIYAHHLWTAQKPPRRQQMPWFFLSLYMDLTWLSRLMLTNCNGVDTKCLMYVERCISIQQVGTARTVMGQGLFTGQVWSQRWIPYQVWGGHINVGAFPRHIWHDEMSYSRELTSYHEIYIFRHLWWSTTVPARWRFNQGRPLCW